MAVLYRKTCSEPKSYFRQAEISVNVDGVYDDAAHRCVISSSREGHPTFFEVETFHAFNEELSENSNFRWLVTPALISQVDGQTRQLPVLKHRNKAPRHDVLVDDVKRLNNNPESRASRSHDDLAFI